MTIDVVKSVRKAGYVPFDLISLSDHRGIFFDLDMATLFDEKLRDVEPAKFRKLKSSHLKRVEEYKKKLTEEWDNHKIDKRLTTLSNDIKNDGPTPENVKRLNDLDRHITDIMRHAEKKMFNNITPCCGPVESQAERIGTRCLILDHTDQTYTT